MLINIRILMFTWYYSDWDLVKNTTRKTADYIFFDGNLLEYIYTNMLLKLKIIVTKLENLFNYMMVRFQNINVHFKGNLVKFVKFLDFV